jgi:hypothetical protein
VTRSLSLGLAVTTFAVLAIAAALIGVMAAPVTPSCFEYCNLSQALARLGLTVIAELWLFVVLAVAWTREPSLTGFSLAVACAFLGGLAYLFSGITSPEAWIWDLQPLILVMALGLQLPPVWRLAGEAGRRRAARATSWVMGIAVGLAGVASIIGGTGPFSWGYGVIGVAFVVFLGAQAVLAVVAIMGKPPRERAAIGLIGAGAALPFAVIVLRIADVDAGRIVALSPLLIAVGWLSMGFIWVGRGTPSQPLQDAITPG